MSAYALTVEPGTPLGKAVAAGERPAPDDDDQARKYEIADDRLGAAGLEWYEISNWARPGDECRHNLLYWAQGDYAGIGCAAHGHAGRAPVVERPHARALHRAGGGRRPGAEAGPTRCSTPDDPAEPSSSTLALRTRTGIKLDGPCRSILLRCLHARRSRRRPGSCDRRHGERVLTRRGRLLANDVTRAAARRARAAGRTRLALGRIECQWISTSARPRS